MVMAAAHQFESVRDEVTCSICLEFFTDPVSIECGHNFCRSCISRCWEGSGSEPSCPQCRTVSRGLSLRPNRELRNIVDMFRLTLSPEKPQEKHVCPKHQQKLQLFCDEDHTLLCVICRESREHKAHAVWPIEEAAEDYREKLNHYKEKLSKEMEKLQLWTAEESSTASALEENYKNQREKIISTFEFLKQFLDNEKQQLLSKLEKEHKENMMKTQVNLNELEISLFSQWDLITEVEEKCQQQDVDVMKDVQSILRRCDQVRIWKPKKDAIVEKTLQSIGENASLQEKLLELKATFPAELEWKYIRGFASEVTLDPDTAHRWLILSEDGKSVRRGDREQDLLDTPKRFTKYAILMGRERITSGRHYWEVEVGDKTGWDLGVCDESVSRTGEITLKPENGFWTVWLRDGEYKALTSSPTLLTPQVPPSAVGFFLDYEAGRFSVYNVNDRSLLFTFSRASFPPTLRPYFNPGLSEEGRNEGALWILPVTGRE